MPSSSKNFAAIREQGAESSATLGRLEQASATQSQMASTMQQEIISRLVSHETMIKERDALRNNQANAMQDMLSQIMQQFQDALKCRPDTSSGVLGEVNEDGIMSVDNSDPATPDLGMTDGSDAQLFESIERLGRLVHEKERTFDDDDVECDTILESLSNILDTAKKRASDMAEDSLARAIGQFTKRHGSYGVVLNSQGEELYQLLFIYAAY